MLIIINDKNYLLNKYQTKIVEIINNKKTNNIADIINVFSHFFEEVGDYKIKKFVRTCIQKLKKLEIIVDKTSKEIKIWGKRGSFYPLKLTIELTDKCVLECSHCFKECSPLSNVSLDAKELLKFLKSIQKFVPFIQLTGGEPMMFKNFDEISSYVTSNFFNSSITTTATLVNSRNITKLANFDNVQVSLYSHLPESHDSITCSKGSFFRTMRGLAFLKQSNVRFSVSNILRREFLIKETFENYLLFLIENKIEEVSFGDISILGRAKRFDKRWELTTDEYEILLAYMEEFNAKFKGILLINLWEEGKSQKFLRGIQENSLVCGAGLTEWTISENGLLKPCSFFPDSHFNDFNYLQFHKVVTSSAGDCLLKNIEEWEQELNSIGMSTKQICEAIYESIKK